jgi:hypothetical protein
MILSLSSAPSTAAEKMALPPEKDLVLGFLLDRGHDELANVFRYR